MNSETKDGLQGRIRRCADIAGSGDALARISGVPRRTLENYLSGRSEPKASALAAIAEAASVSLDWLVRGIEPMRLAAPHRISPRVDGRARPAAPGLAEESGRWLAPDTYLPEGFVLIPRYDIEASAGPGALVAEENIVDFMAFQEGWVRRALRVDPRQLVLVTAVGDSMEPTIRAGDLLLVDTSVDRVVDDAIYVVSLDGDLVVKRLQRFFSGAVSVKSDNPAYVDQTLDARQVSATRIAGRVRWIGRLT